MQLQNSKKESCKQCCVIRSHVFFAPTLWEVTNCNCLPSCHGVDIVMLYMLFSSQDLFLNAWQCCRSMTFWGGFGSGSADPCLWLMDPDPDSSLTIKMPAKNKFFITIFSAYYFFFQGTNSRNQGFSHYFCMMIEGSRCGSGRPKNMWIRWIRIRNTDAWHGFLSLLRILTSLISRLLEGILMYL